MRPPTLLAMTSYLAGHVSRIGRASLSDALAEHGLRPPHLAVLAALGDFGPLPQHELADRLGLNRSHLVKYLDELESGRLVLRVRDPGDRRTQRVELCPPGRDLLDSLTGVAHRAERDYLHMLSARERKTLKELLRRVVNGDDEAGGASATARRS